jgi:hypothetical protein
MHLSDLMTAERNFFDMIEHVRDKDAKTDEITFSAGDLILPCGDPTDALYALRDGIVVAKEIDPFHGRHVEAHRFIGVPGMFTPIFAADAYAYSAPTSYVYEAETGGKLSTFNSAFVNRLCQGRGVLFLAREIVRASELSERLRPKLVRAHEETGLPGFDPEATDRLFVAATVEEQETYIRFARDLMAEITTWRRVRSAFPSTKMKALPRIFPSGTVLTREEADDADRRTTAIRPLERRIP